MTVRILEPDMTIEELCERLACAIPLPSTARPDPYRQVVRLEILDDEGRVLLPLIVRRLDVFRNSVHLQGLIKTLREIVDVRIEERRDADAISVS